jgi:hypothetical protein
MIVEFFTEILPIISVLTPISIMAGGIFAIIQWNSVKKLKRAENMDKILNHIRYDQEMSKIMYTIEYEKEDWHDAYFHNHKGDLEFKIDKFLSYIDYICYLHNTKNISHKEFNIIKYHVDMVCKTFSVQAYLWNLYHFSKK